MSQLEGLVTIITGASTGIGRAIAHAFAVEGAHLAIAGRNQRNLDAVSQELRAHGTTVLAIPTDVTDEAQVGNLFSKTLETFGRLDILVNNAGVFAGGPLDTLALETWHRVIEVNLTGPFLCSREAMKVMKRQRAGRIINIGSISAQVPRLNSVPYTASKFGLEGLTRAAALEGRDYGVVVSCLHPGNVASEWRLDNDEPMHQEPMMMPNELARVVVALAALPLHVNMLQVIVLPTTQPYLGRG
jgi:NAD(P)-dependent dehydrogenase (short-subunit alcohol dehydrogenase family)